MVGTTYRLDNTRAEPLTVIVEPWAEEFTVDAGSTLFLTISSDRPGILETRFGDDAIVCCLWQGCRAEVSLNGRSAVRSSLQIPAPG